MIITLFVGILSAYSFMLLFDPITTILYFLTSPTFNLSLSAPSPNRHVSQSPSLRPAITADVDAASAWASSRTRLPRCGCTHAFLPHVTRCRSLPSKLWAHARHGEQPLHNAPPASDRTRELTACLHVCGVCRRSAAVWYLHSICSAHRRFHPCCHSSLPSD